MNRSKRKTTKVGKPGYRNISSFFSPQKPKDSFTAAITFTKTEPLVKEATPSPSNRIILGVLENVLLSSPELLTIPETPDSQICPDSTTSTRDPWQLSPVGRSTSRGQGLRKDKRTEARTEKRANESAYSVKRLFSPSEECFNAKRPRTTTLQITNVIGRRTSSSKETRPVLVPLKTGFLYKDSFNFVSQNCEKSVCTAKEGSGLQVALPKPVSVRGISPHLFRGKIKLNEKEAGDQEELPFTGITGRTAAAERDTHACSMHSSDKPQVKEPMRDEKGAAGTAVTSFDGDRIAVSSLDGDGIAVSSLDGDGIAVSSFDGDGIAVTSLDGDRIAVSLLDGDGIAVTLLDGDRIAVTSLDGDRIAGTPLGGGKGNAERVASECPMIEDSWFDDQMDLTTGPVREEKINKHHKVPEHVILSGGLNNRYWVLEVEEKPSHKILTMSCSKSLHPIETCLLKDGWETTPVSCGDVVHLEGQCDAGCWLVDREKGFLVLLPDVLISGTSISSSIRCMRRAVLGEIFKTFDGGSKQMLNGTMVHEVFQKAAMAKDFSAETLSLLADRQLCSPQHLGTMYSLGLTQEEMKQELCEYLPSLKHWANEYLDPAAPKVITLKLNGGASLKGHESSAAVATVTELADIEDNVWSPRFGLKGKIDVSARVRVQRAHKDRRRAPEEMIMPLELKTGKETNSIEHRSQVILYTLMSMQRYADAGAGFLLYLKTGNMHPVVAGHMDRRELLQLRNTLTHYLGKSVEKGEEHSHLSGLPEILTNRQTCQYCPQKRNCALYERVVDSSSPDLSQDAVQDFLTQETGHLSLPHLNYFSHWLLLCCLEAATMEIKNGRRHVWLQTAEEREKSGECVGNLQLNGPVSVQSEGVFLHHFLRRGVASQGVSCGLADGDRIVVSDQDVRLVGLATGYFRDVRGALVSCTLDRDLSKFSDVMFRLDHDEGVIGLGTHLTNLSRLMENSPDSDRLRELVVDLRPPEFIPSLSSVLPREAKDTVANILKGLNKPQKQAMKKVLLSKDYTLIIGMPGTGKTTTICTLVRILHACGFSVLLSSYTHSAVDNILLKLKRFRVGFLRLGRGQKVHPDILPYTEESVRKNGIHTLSELEHLYSKELVVATTCMGTKHAIFTRRKFDFCIVDEASQISQPDCLGPLFHAKRFVLVGDHQQLPPIVQNQEARSKGMDESLFKRLELHSKAVVQLNVQYRMNREIMSLSNSLVYDGRLECGSEKTASTLLSLPFLLSVQSELTAHSETHPQLDLDWLQAALLPSNPVCFLDTSLVPALETVDKGGISNHTEASLIHTLLSLLIKAGCKSSDIGVIAPYRQQLKSISAQLRSSAFSGVEVNTVDRYQGRDKSLIVLSFVRSTAEEGNLGELLKDWRRLNVAVTRAKHKLLMVGSASTLRRYAPLEKLLSHLQQESMMIQLPPAANQALPSMHL